ncbi:MAG: hypothetical protein K6F32_06545 [Bacilli bacterium]|nr:hypothetical protein [Bacilli bacterium]
MNDNHGLFPYADPDKVKAIEKYLGAPELIRLKNVGMHCGLEYTSFPFYKDLGSYSRYVHSVGVALICLNFSDDLKVALSGLFHDISTPCFAHVIDFLNGDHDTQESTEASTRDVIQGSSRIMELLREDGFSLDDVSDYHRYPIADNDSPRLSADRLEYTISNFINFGLMPFEEAVELYKDIEVGTNEEGMTELVFKNEDRALKFALNCLENGRIYVADEDRFSMEYLARKLLDAISRGVISRPDLMLTEPILIDKLCRDPKSKADWESFRALRALERHETPVEGAWKIGGKKRFIDPYVKGRGRLSGISEEFRNKVKAFKSVSFGLYLKSAL